jgi:hypothetical protein
MWERTLKGRLEMRRQAMLNMPSMIQEWKQVRCFAATRVEGFANDCVEGPWTRVEEVAEWEGEEVNFGCWIWKHMVEDWRNVQWHLQAAFRHTFSFTHCSVPNDCIYTYDMRKNQLIASNIHSAVDYDRVGRGYPACLLACVNSNLVCKFPHRNADTHLRRLKTVYTSRQGE